MCRAVLRRSGRLRGRAICSGTLLALDFGSPRKCQKAPHILHKLPEYHGRRYPFSVAYFIRGTLPTKKGNGKKGTTGGPSCATWGRGERSSRKHAQEVRRLVVPAWAVRVFGSPTKSEPTTTPNTKIKKARGMAGSGTSSPVCETLRDLREFVSSL